MTGHTGSEWKINNLFNSTLDQDRESHESIASMRRTLSYLAVIE